MRTFYSSFLLITSIFYPNFGYANTNFSQPSENHSQPKNSSKHPLTQSSMTAHSKIEKHLSKTAPSIFAIKENPLADFKNEFEKYLSISWTNDDKKLYLTITYSKKLRINEMNITKNDDKQFCVEILSTPIHKKNSFLGKQRILERIACKVFLKDQGSKGIKCKELLETTVQLTKKTRYPFETTTSEKKYQLVDVSINVNHHPEFSSTSKTKHGMLKQEIAFDLATS